MARKSFRASRSQIGTGRHGSRSPNAVDGQSEGRKRKKNRGSLKKQLRGKERLLLKLMTDHDSRQKTGSNGCDDEEDEGDEDGYTGAKELLEEQILELKRQITERARVELERKNATRYHKVKFFERQKLSRMERKVRRKLREARAEVKTDLEKQLRHIQLDQQYVKHFPNDTKYIALFPGGKHFSLLEEDENIRSKRNSIREKIAIRLRIDVKASVLVEQSVPLHAENLSSGETAGRVDGHRCKKDIHSIVPQRSKEKKLAQTQFDASYDSDRLDKARNGDSSSSSGSDTSGTSSSSEENDGASVDHDSDPGEEGADLIGTGQSLKSPADSDDDFFMDANGQDDDSTEMFENAVHHDHGVGSARRDKSRGWDTQRQKPGQYKKQRVRR